jgi:hypothetical protein
MFEGPTTDIHPYLNNDDPRRQQRYCNETCTDATDSAVDID